MGTVSAPMTGSGTIGDIAAGWSVQEDATPVNVNDSSGGTGSINAGAVATPTSRYIVDNTVSWTDTDLGSIPGNMGDVNDANAVVTFTISPVLSLLNADVTAPPVGSTALSAIVLGYVSLLTDQVPVIWDASTDPVQTYKGWSGNLWLNLKMLLAVNRLEGVPRSDGLHIRDWGSVTLDITDNNTASVSESTINTALSVDLVCQNPSLVSSFNSQQLNYDQNPKLGVNATNWSGTRSGVTATQSRISAGIFQSAVTSSAASNNATDFHAINHVIDVSGLSTALPFALAMSGTYHAQSGGIGGTQYEITGLWSSGASAFTKITRNGVRGNNGNLSFSKTGLVKPAGATTLTITVKQVDTTGASSPAHIILSDYIIMNNCLFTDGPLVSYFDGSSGGGPNIPPYSWVGATDNSASIRAIPVVNSMYDAYADGNNVLTIAAGDTKSFTLQTKNYPTFLAQPVQSGFLPILTGQYYVSGADNLPIVASEWSAYGGSVTVAIGTDPGTIVVTLVGPRINIPSAAGPYSLSASDGQNEYATLSIAGLGVVTKPTTVNVLTGADPAKTTQATIGEIDCPFINDLGTLYDAASWICVDLAGAAMVLSATIPLAKLKALGGFGQIAGAVVRYKNDFYRVVTASISRAGVSITARRFTRMGDLDTAWSGQTLGAYDTVWGAPYDLGDTQIGSLRKS